MNIKIQGPRGTDYVNVCAVYEMTDSSWAVYADQNSSWPCSPEALNAAIGKGYTLEGALQDLTCQLRQLLPA